MTGYYDVVLGLIPVSLLGGTGALTMLADLELTTAVPIAALFAAFLVGHAMFVRGPTDHHPEAEPSQSSAPNVKPPHAD
ncbi:hypothetical protein [Haloarchaeobius sp. TZWWS8]|uniref:hypothetical protein n=1 Tax=Haloarchaeobius sp. TZWWS8 TaxID=3446121 RepID=UPI003EBC04F3